MYETAFDIITAHNVYCALRITVTGLLLLLLVCGLPSSYVCDSDSRKGKMLNMVDCACILLILACGVGLQLYPNANEARALIEELAERTGTDAAPYIKIIDNAH